MDWTNIARAFFTILCLVSFLLITFIAYRASSKQRYDDAANRIMMDEDKPLPSNGDDVFSRGVKNNE